MPRLKLDIFSTQTDSPEAALMERMTVAQVPNEELQKPIRELATNDSAKTESPTFIPVGFTGELAALEEAVFRLRQTGHRQASKSAIIRALITMHEGDLDKVWLAERRNNRAKHEGEKREKAGQCPAQDI